MKIFMLDWPAATAGATSAQISGVGVQDDGVEEDVGDRLPRDQRRLVAHAVGDRLPGNDVRHVPDGGDAARQRRLGAARVVVDPLGIVVEPLDVQVDVRVDAARQHEALARVDLAGAGHGAADLGDAPARHADVGPLAPLGRHDGPAAHDEVEAALGIGPPSSAGGGGFLSRVRRDGAQVVAREDTCGGAAAPGVRPKLSAARGRAPPRGPAGPRHARARRGC